APATWAPPPPRTSPARPGTPPPPPGQGKPAPAPARRPAARPATTGQAPAALGPPARGRPPEVQAPGRGCYPGRMCGRFTLHSPSRVIAAALSLPAGAEFPPRYNVPPPPPVAVGRAGGAGTRELASLAWGLVPAWSKDPAAGFINARSETAADKPAFRGAFRRRRCLVPADGFYEWQRGAAGKQPFYFRL